MTDPVTTPDPAVPGKHWCRWCDAYSGTPCGHAQDATPSPPPPAPARGLCRTCVGWVRADLTDAEMDAPHHPTCPLAQIEDVAAWQTASGLLGGSGDPSDVTPAQLSNYIQALDSVAYWARELFARGPAEEQHVKDMLRSALAALPDEEV